MFFYMFNKKKEKIMSTIMRVLGIMVVGLALHTVVRAGSIALAPSKKCYEGLKRRDKTEGRHGFRST